MWNSHVIGKQTSGGCTLGKPLPWRSLQRWNNCMKSMCLKQVIEMSTIPRNVKERVWGLWNLNHEESLAGQLMLI